MALTEVKNYKNNNKSAHIPYMYIYDKMFNICDSIMIDIIREF